MVRSIFTFGMDHIKKLKVLLLHYHFGSEGLKGAPKKVEIVEAVTDLSLGGLGGSYSEGGGGGLVVTN